MKRLPLVLLILSLSLAGCGGGASDEPPITPNPQSDTPGVSVTAAGQTTVKNEGDAVINDYFSANSRVADVIDAPAFEGFGQYLFPIKTRSSYDRDMRLSGIDSLLPYHDYIRTDTTVEVVNYMINEVNGGNTIFYDIYTEQQKQADATKKDTGLFFFRGEPGAPFAVICAGGGFSYVGSIHESFPHALELSKKGYNAFAIEYRVGSEQAATEDLAAAISFIMENAAALGVGADDYSLWGGSAGARMAANIGSYGVAAFGGANIPGPGTVVIAYTGHSGYTQNDTPTFTMISENDPIVSVSTVDLRVADMRRAGIDVEYEKYKSAGHGFGLGIGTDAEGWLDRAVVFWEKHISSTVSGTVSSGN